MVGFFKYCFIDEFFHLSLFLVILSTYSQDRTQLKETFFLKRFNKKSKIFLNKVKINPLSTNLFNNFFALEYLIFWP